MNCHLHPKSVALVFCRHCGKPLCRGCCRVSILGQRRVCSEECAQFAALQPSSTEPEDTPIQRIYSYVFLVVLLAALGGGLCLWIAKSEIARSDYNAEAEARGEWVSWREQKGTNGIFYQLGIRDWRLQFGIGAAIGVAIAVVWIRRSNKAERAEKENAADVG